MMQLFKSLPIAGVFMLLRFQGHSTAKLKWGKDQFSLDVCPGRWTAYNDSCYILMDKNKTWTHAQSTCKKFGGNLATITSPGENSVLDSLLPRLPKLTSHLEQEAWIGLKDRANEGTFKWIGTSSRPSWTKWASGEPNNDLRNEYCVAIMPGGYWNDEPCSYRLNFICELSS